MQTARATPPSWQSWLWTSPPATLKIPQRRTKARCQHWGERAACGEGARGLKSFRLKSVLKLPLLPLMRVGGSAEMVSRLSSANEVIQKQLSNYLSEIEQCCGANCLSYRGPITFGVDDWIRRAVECLANRADKRRKLLFLLETYGGYAEVVRRISDTLRHHYRVVDYLIASHAMSAGTILAMSGDAILMDYHSVLGPIDPQVENQDGKLVPALGYLIRYEDLLANANSGKITTVEMAILLNFDQGNLYSYQQARDLSVALLQEWLVKYKFKDWKKTATQKISVTAKMKKERAREIAEKLNDSKRWNSHGIGISMECLRRDLNLKIDDFALDKKLDGAVRRYHELLTDYMGKNRHQAVVNIPGMYEPLTL